jgi:hypothetical protein
MDNPQQNQAPLNPQPVPNKSAPGGPPHNGGFLKQLEDFFNTYLHQKAPFHLPKEAKEWIVKFGPWITLVLMIIAVPVILAALGLNAVFGSAIMMYSAYHVSYLISGLIALLALILQGLALPGLFARKLSGWHLVYYSVLISAIGQLFSGQIVTMIVNVIISMYFLFEIKEYYK